MKKIKLGEQRQREIDQLVGRQTKRQINGVRKKGQEEEDGQIEKKKTSNIYILK